MRSLEKTTFHTLKSIQHDVGIFRLCVVQIGLVLGIIFYNRESSPFPSCLKILKKVVFTPYTCLEKGRKTLDEKMSTLSEDPKSKTH